MTQIKTILIELKAKDRESKLEETRQSLQDGWFIVEKSVLQEAVIYFMAKLSEEQLQQLRQKQTLQNVLQNK